jgi:butyryl-CoA dehydrogenase
MNFELTPDQAALRDAAREFAQNEMADVGREIELTNEPLSKHAKRRLGEMGFMGVNIATQYGGLGLGALEALLILEEFAKVHTGMAFPIFESCVGPVKAIEHLGHETLKRRVLPAVVRGEHVIAIAMSEPGAGTALTDLTTRGGIRGDRVVLNGVKRWCSGGGCSDGYLVYCRLSDDPGAHGIGAVYVDKDSVGLSFGKREELMGFRGVYSADIFLDDVEVPLENLVAPAGGFARLMGAFCLERCGNATMSLGIAAAALDDITDYVQERHAFGKPIVEFQAIQLKLAEIAMQVEASRLLIHRAVAGVGTGFPNQLDSSIAKCFANEMVRDVTGKAMQMMGGYGYSKAYPAEQRFRDAWGWGIAGGSIDIQKVNIAGSLAGRRFNQRSK